MRSKAEEKFVRLLNKFPKTKEDMVEKEKARLEFEKELDEQEKDLIADLKAVGIEVKCVWDLVNTKESYWAAIPVLLEHLSKPYHHRIKEGIIRALGVKDAKGKATPLLIAEYHKIPIKKMDMRWAVGNTVYTTITKADVESILPIVRDKENGFSREPFIVALGKIKSSVAEDVLIELLTDKEVAAYAVNALGKMKSKKALEKIGQLLESPQSSQMIKNEAIKAIRKIEDIKKL